MTREEVIKQLAVADKRHRERVGFNACRINGLYLFQMNMISFLQRSIWKLNTSPRIIFQLVAYYNIKEIS